MSPERKKEIEKLKARMPCHLSMWAAWALEARVPAGRARQRDGDAGAGSLRVGLRLHELPPSVEDYVIILYAAVETRYVFVTLGGRDG